jgi:hypothetical protein
MIDTPRKPSRRRRPMVNEREIFMSGVVESGSMEF